MVLENPVQRRHRFYIVKKALAGVDLRKRYGAAGKYPGAQSPALGGGIRVDKMKATPNGCRRPYLAASSATG